MLNEKKDFGKIELNISGEVLQEVELIAEKTEVEIRLDKRIYNVGKDLTVRGKRCRCSRQCSLGYG